MLLGFLAASDDRADFDFSKLQAPTLSLHFKTYYFEQEHTQALGFACCVDLVSQYWPRGGQCFGVWASRGRSVLDQPTPTSASPRREGNVGLGGVIQGSEQHHGHMEFRPLSLERPRSSP